MTRFPGWRRPPGQASQTEAPLPETTPSVPAEEEQSSDTAPAAAAPEPVQLKSEPRAETQAQPEQPMDPAGLLQSARVREQAPLPVEKPEISTKPLQDAEAPPHASVAQPSVDTSLVSPGMLKVVEALGSMVDTRTDLQQAATRFRQCWSLCQQAARLAFPKAAVEEADDIARAIVGFAARRPAESVQSLSEMLKTASEAAATLWPSATPQEAFAFRSGTAMLASLAVAAARMEAIAAKDSLGQSPPVAAAMLLDEASLAAALLAQQILGRERASESVAMVQLLLPHTTAMVEAAWDVEVRTRPAGDNASAMGRIREHVRSRMDGIVLAVTTALPRLEEYKPVIHPPGMANPGVR